MPLLPLSHKTALVTGASQGIGLASARALAQDGATVVIMSRRQSALAKAQEELASEIPGGRVEICVGDALEESDVKNALMFAHSLAGRLDIIVSSVGGASSFTPLLMRDVQSVRQEMDLNFTTAFLAVRHGAPLLQPGGAIVCVSTAATLQANWGLSIYSAAKAAVERFVRAAAFELAGAGIRVNAVRPGSTLAKERAESPELSLMAQAFAAVTPLGRLGRPEDIGPVVRFLAGPESGWVTGQTLSADGALDQCSAPDLMDAIHGKDVMARIRGGKPIS